ncbi:MAG: hypothetical protein R3F44_17550 [Candidatus Competibacteraceae bacterium]
MEELTWNLEEPFDNHMTLPRAVYLAAHRCGLKVLLDGVAGDVVLGEGVIWRGFCDGRWLTACHEAVGLKIGSGANTIPHGACCITVRARHLLLGRCRDLLPPSTPTEPTTAGRGEHTYFLDQPGFRTPHVHRGAVANLEQPPVGQFHPAMVLKLWKPSIIPI